MHTRDPDKRWPIVGGRIMLGWEDNVGVGE